MWEEIMKENLWNAETTIIPEWPRTISRPKHLPLEAAEQREKIAKWMSSSEKKEGDLHIHSGDHNGNDHHDGYMYYGYNHIDK